MSYAWTLGNGFNTANDPYFQAVYQSYNPNFRGTQSAQAAQAAQAAAQTAPTSEDLKNMYPNGNTGLIVPKQEKKSNAGWVIAGTVLTVGAAALCFAAHRKGVGEGTFARIKDGLGKMLSGAGSKAEETFKVLKNKTGDWICEIPGKKQNIQAAAADSLNISTNVSKLGEAGTEFRNAFFKKDGWTYTVRDGKIVSIWQQVGGKGTPVIKQTAEKVAEANKNKTIQNAIQLIQSGKAGDVATKLKGITVDSVRFRDINNGAIRNFVTDSKGNTDLKSILTNRFHIDSAAVDSFRLNNPGVDEALKTLQKGKKLPDGLRVAEAQCKYNGDTLKFENGNLVEINGKRKGLHDEFDSYIYRNPKTPLDVESLPKGATLINPIYSL